MCCAGPLRRDKHAGYLARQRVDHGLDGVHPVARDGIGHPRHNTRRAASNAAAAAAAAEGPKHVLPVRRGSEEVPRLVGAEFRGDDLYIEGAREVSP